MRAIVATRLGGPEVLQLREEPEPVPGADQVLIRVAGAGVNFADLLSTRGSYAGAPAPPFIPGLEVAGYELTSSRPVMALVRSGGYAEVVAADRRLTFSADGLDLGRAAGIPLVTLTAYYALHEVARLRPGESVLIVPGAGGLGSTAIQVARALGAGQIVAVASTDAKRAFAREQGADRALGYEDSLPPVDVVIDGVGGDAFLRALESVRPVGRMVLLGTASGQPPSIPTFAELRRRNVAIMPFSLGALRAVDAEHVARVAPAAFDLVRRGVVRPPATRTLPLQEAAEAHRLVLSRQTMGKVLLAVT